MSDGVAYNPCSACKKDDLCNICELRLYRSGAISVDKWINVDERLPEENGRYLVCVAIRHLVFEDLTMVVIMGYNKIKGFDVVSGEEIVTHWMPLPEPPKMKGGAE